MPTAPDPAAPLPSGLRERMPGWARDAIAALVIVVTVVGPLVRSTVEVTPLGITAAALPAAFMFVRRRWPWAVLVACVVCFVGATVAFGMTPFSALPTGFALLTLATRTTRLRALLATIGAIAVMVPASVLWEPAGQHPLTVLMIVMVAFFAAVGDAVRTQRAYLAQAAARVAEAEATRDAEASRRVAEERLRIARELHDTLAHQVSVISLQSGVASRTIDDDPDAAKEALAHVRGASRRVLAEIGGLLAALRAADAAPAPEPGLRALAPLVREFEASGMRVALTLPAEVVELPPSVDLVAYRVIQESLTNAQKHGKGGGATVRVTREAGNLRVEVENPATPRPAPDDRPTHGLIGMRERVTALGGTLEAGLDDGTFRVTALLPLADAEAAP